MNQLRQYVVMVIVLFALGACSHKAQVASFSSTATLKINGVSINQGKIYAATQSGVSVSTDNGATWRSVSLGCNGTNVQNNCYDVSVVFAIGTKLYAGVNNGLMMSPNDGYSWQFSQPAVTGYWAMPSPSSQYLFIANGVGIFPKGFSYSTDNAGTWTNIPMQDAYSNGGVQKVYAVGGTFYAFTAQLFNGDIQKSTDQGGTWTDITPTQLTSGAGQDGPTDVMVVNGNLLASSSHGVFVSSDGGQTWSLKTTANGLGANSIDALAFDGTRVWALSDSYPGGLSYSSDNGATWTAVALPANVESLIFYPSWRGFTAEGNLLAIAGNPTGIAISSDAGVTWSVVGK